MQLCLREASQIYPWPSNWIDDKVRRTGPIGNLLSNAGSFHDLCERKSASPKSILCCLALFRTIHVHPSRFPDSAARSCLVCWCCRASRYHCRRCWSLFLLGMMIYFCFNLCCCCRWCNCRVKANSTVSLTKCTTLISHKWRCCTGCGRCACCPYGVKNARWTFSNPAPCPSNSS